MSTSKWLRNIHSETHTHIAYIDDCRYGINGELANTFVYYKNKENKKCSCYCLAKANGNRVEDSNMKVLHTNAIFKPQWKVFSEMFNL